MLDGFDPYFKWLGIPPEEQPPHHYRLLGIPAFVSDEDVIANAADQRMVHLKSFQTGKHAALSQQILNQVAAARACLLNVQRKAAYDRELRETLMSVTPAAQVSARAPVRLEPLDQRTLSTAALDDREEIELATPVPRRPSPATPAEHQQQWEFDRLAAAVRGERQVVKGHAAQDRDMRSIVIVVVCAAFFFFGAIGWGVIYFLGRGDKSEEPKREIAQKVAAPSKEKYISPPVAPEVAPPSFTRRRAASTGAGLRANDSVILPVLEDSKSTTSPTSTTKQPRARPLPPANADELFAMAEKALAEKNLDAAEKALLSIVRDPGAAKHEAAQLLLAQLKTVTSNDWGRNFLRSLDNVTFAAFEHNRLQINFGDLDPALVSIANDTLRRMMPEIMKERATGPPPTKETRSDQVPIIKPPAAGPVDPAEYLKALGLKRTINVWVVPDEARCKEVVEQLKQARTRQVDLGKQQPDATLKVIRARSAKEQSERTLQKAEAADSPARGTPERTRLEERTAEARGVYEDARKEVDRLKLEKAAAEKQETDAMAEARRLVTAADDQYRRLANDRQVSGALDQLKQRLGPSEEFTKMREELKRPQLRSKD